MSDRFAVRGGGPGGPRPRRVSDVGRVRRGTVKLLQQKGAWKMELESWD